MFEMMPDVLMKSRVLERSYINRVILLRKQEDALA